MSNHSHFAPPTHQFPACRITKHDHLLPCLPNATDIYFLSTASWNWNGSAPSGEVAEKKAEGEVSVQSKRGNTIKKSAQPNDPAIHLARPGNDVVKNQSELNVEEKASGGDANGTEEKDDAAAEEQPEATPAKAKAPAKSPVNKRKATKEADPDKEAKKARGRPKGAAAAPKDKKEPKEKKEKEKPAPKEKQEKPAKTEGEKKSRGRPAKDPDATKAAPKAKKAAKPAKEAAKPVGVGKRTRSQAK